MNVLLSYADPSVNGQLLFTVSAKDKKSGKVYYQHRFDLEDDGQRRAFCDHVANVLESPESSGELDRLIREYADAQRRRLNGRVTVAAATTGTQQRMGRPLAAYRPFPTHVLPFTISRFVREAAVAVGCDESFVALPLLVGLAAAVGNSRVIRIKFDWSEPSVLWAAVIAGSGERKTPPFYKALRPLHDMQAAALDEHRAAMEEFKRDLKEYKRAMSAFNKGGGEEEDGEGWKGPPEEPRRPVLKRFVVIDTTVEALAARLEENPRGLALIRDELSGWFASFNQYKSGKGSDSAQWLEMHRAGAVSVDRKTGDRPSIFVPRAAVSVGGTIQPGILARSLGGEHFESGMAARFLFAMPPARTRCWSDAEIDSNTRDRIATLYARLASLEPGADGKPLDVPLSPAALAAFKQFVNEHGLEQDGLESQNLKAAWSKLEGAAARLALVVHLSRVVMNDSTLADPNAVDERSIGAGITLARWFGHEARRVYAGIGQTTPERDREWLLNKVRDRGGRLTPRELQKGWRRYKTAETARAALMDLVTAGLGKFVLPKPDAKGGRPSEVFVLSEPDDDADDDHQRHTETPADSADSDETPSADVAEGVSSAGGPESAGSVGASLKDSAEPLPDTAPPTTPADETASDGSRAADTPADGAGTGDLSASALSAPNENKPKTDPPGGMEEVVV